MQAIEYIKTHPGQVALNIGRKSLEFASHTEVANNRSMVEERLFSPVLRLLPSPFAWLFALGVPGLILLLWRDRRGLLTLAPVLVVLATFAIFFAEARFRFHAVPMLALGAGLFIEDILSWVRHQQTRHLAWGLAAAIMLGGVSAWATMQVPAPTVSWNAIVWGFIKMGDLEAAQTTVEKVPAGSISSAKWEEALGFIAWSRQDLETAALHYERAVELNPGSHVAHYNLAMMLARMGQPEKAVIHTRIALGIAQLPEYQQLLQSLQVQ